MNINDVYKKYFEEFKSVQEIAEEYNTYPLKVTKLLKDNGYKLRTKSESQKIALELGKTKHPTKGTIRPDHVKEAISNSNHEVWKNLSEEEKEHRSKIGKENWDSLPEEKKSEFLNKGQEAVRKAAKEGSIMENYLYKLIKEKYNVIMHKKGLIANEKLEVDLYVSDLNVIIEIDGPAHFQDLWNEGTLSKNMQSDNEKNALFINKGFTVIRAKDLRQNKSKIYFKQSGEKIMDLLKNIKAKKIKKKYIEIEF